MPNKQNSETTVFVAMPGAEPYATLTKNEVRERVAKGSITQSQLIWSAQDNDWRPVRDFSQLQPGAVEKAPAARAASTAGIEKAQPARAASAGRSRDGKPDDGLVTPFPGVKAARPDSSSGAARMPSPEKVTAMLKAKMESGRVPSPVQVPRPVATSGPVPATASAPSPVKPKVVAVKSAKPVVAAVSPVAQASAGQFSGKSATVDEGPQGMSKMKLFCIGLGGLILLVIAANWLLVDRPLKSIAAQAGVPSGITFAHLGGFVQPGHIIIRVNPTAIKEGGDGNLLSLLIALAKFHTQPVFGGQLESVSLYVGTTPRFIIRGGVWHELGERRDNRETAHWLAGETFYAGTQNKVLTDLKSDNEAWQEIYRRLSGN